MQRELSSSGVGSSISPLQLEGQAFCSLVRSAVTGPDQDGMLSDAERRLKPLTMLDVCEIFAFFVFYTVQQRYR